MWWSLEMKANAHFFSFELDECRKSINQMKGLFVFAPKMSDGESIKLDPSYRFRFRSEKALISEWVPYFSCLKMLHSVLQNQLAISIKNYDGWTICVSRLWMEITVERIPRMNELLSSKWTFYVKLNSIELPTANTRWDVCGSRAIKTPEKRVVQKD